MTQSVSSGSKTRAVWWREQCIGGKGDEDKRISLTHHLLLGLGVMEKHLGARLRD